MKMKIERNLVFVLDSGKCTKEGQRAGSARTRKREGNGTKCDKGWERRKEEREKGE